MGYIHPNGSSKRVQRQSTWPTVRQRPSIFPEEIITQEQNSQKIKVRIVTNAVDNPVTITYNHAQLKMKSVPSVQNEDTSQMFADQQINVNDMQESNGNQLEDEHNEEIEAEENDPVAYVELI